MSLTALLSFTLSVIVLAIAPGPDNIFVLTQSAMYGYKKGLAVVIGLALGIFVQTLCMVAGVTTLLIAIPILMTILKGLGALYLSYLCYKAAGAFIELLKDNDAPSSQQSQCSTVSAQETQTTDAEQISSSQSPELALEHADNSSNPSRANDQDIASKCLDGKASGSQAESNENRILNFRMIRRGLINNCTNPKVQLFFLSFFPQFLPSGISETQVMFYMSLMGLIMAIVTLVVFGSIAIFAGVLAAQFQTRSFNLILNGSAVLIFAALAIFTIGSEFI